MNPIDAKNKITKYYKNAIYGDKILYLMMNIILLLPKS